MHVKPGLNAVTDWRHVKKPLSVDVWLARCGVPSLMSAPLPDAGPWLPVQWDSGSWWAAGL